MPSNQPTIDTGDIDAKLAEQDAKLADHEARIAALEAAAGGTPPVDPPPVEPPIDPPPTTEPGPNDLYLPISFPDLQALLDAGLGAPGHTSASDPVYVTWPANPGKGAGGGEWSLEDQFRAMKDGEYLVLPERDAVYPIDASEGFASSGVDHIHDTSWPAGDQDEPVSGTWHGKGARTWFAMTRTRQGIIGLGPRAVIEPTDSGFSRRALGDEDTSTWVDPSGKATKINGCPDGLIDTASGDTHFANFTLRGRTYGDMAYCGIKAKKVNYWRIHFDGCWRGSTHAPNNETGAAAAATHDVRNVLFDCHDTALVGVKNSETSVFMANRAGPSLMRDVMITDDATGAITYWESTPGTTLWERVWSKRAINLEANGKDGIFTFEAHGGAIGGDQFQINLRSPYTSQHVELYGVQNLATRAEGWVGNNWGNAPYMQKASDTKAWDAAGNPEPFKHAGNTAPE